MNNQNNKLNNENTQKTICCLKYTGNKLANRNMNKLITTIYKNFSDIGDKPELNHTRKEIHRLLCSPKSIIIIAVTNNIIVGYLLAEVTVVDDLKQLMHIYYIFTAPKYRGKGIASYMLDLIEKYAQEINITTLSLTFDTQDEKLEKFYLSKGFVYDQNLRSHQRHDMVVKFLW